MANMLSWLTGREEQGQPQPFAVNDGQPSLRAYNPTPSERVGNWIQDLLMAGGAQAYPAGHVAHGVRDLLSMSPLGIGMSAADMLHAKSADDPMGAAAAAIGMVPGLKPEVQAVRQGIRAFHGSPHDFDRFDISKIGTGEGAQAYGHGMYFAENEKVAQAYRNDPKMMSWTKGRDWTDAQEEAFNWLHEHGYDQAKASAGIEKRIGQARMYGDTPDSTKSLQEVKSIIDSGWVPPRGKMYEVNINAKPEQFLDWDRRIADQGDHIANLLKKNFDPQMTGQEAYQSMVKYRPNSGGGTTGAFGSLDADPTEVSGRFNASGIPGIRYLDQGSRQLGEKASVDDAIARIVDIHGGDQKKALAELEGRYTSAMELPEKYRATNTVLPDAIERLKAGWQDPRSRNYVLFNDQLVDIMRKYGLAAPAAAGAASYAMQPQEASAAKAQPAQFQPPVPLSNKISQMIDSLQW